MKIRYVQPAVYISLDIHYVYEHPVTKEPTLFKEAIQTTLVNSLNGTDPLLEHLKVRFGNDVELEDLGLWDNVKTAEGLVKHPFTGEMMKT